MPSKRAESVFPHETAEMQANLLLRREDIFSHVPCTRDFAKFLKEMCDPLGLCSSLNDGNGMFWRDFLSRRGCADSNSTKDVVNVMLVHARCAIQTAHLAGNVRRLRRNCRSGWGAKRTHDESFEQYLNSSSKPACDAFNESE